MSYKLDFESEYENLITRKNDTHVNVKKYILQKAYRSKTGLTAAKMKDLECLWKNNIILSQYHSFYACFGTRTAAAGLTDEDD